MRIKIPDTFMGKPIEGAMEKVLKQGVSNPPAPQNPPLNPPMNLDNPENYILLPAKCHGTSAYPDLCVAMHRLSFNEPEVQNAAQRLNLNLKNTARENNGHEYIGQIDWKEALSLNLAMGNFTLPPRRGIDFLIHLKEGLENKIQVYNGLNQPVPIEKIREIYDEIAGVRAPFRGEWLDADYKVVGNELWLYSEHVLQGNTLEPEYKKKLLPCLMKKGEKVKLATCNEQGMPTENGDDIHYWCPDKDNKSVGRFRANSDRANLDCDRNPADRNVALGVRRAVRRAAPKI